MAREELARSGLDRKASRRFDEASDLRRGRGPPGNGIERQALLQLGRIGQPDRNRHHPRLCHAVAVAQPPRQRHRLVVALRSEKLVDVRAVLGQIGAIELVTAGELEDDRDQLDAAVNADAELVRLCGCRYG